MKNWVTPALIVFTICMWVFMCYVAGFRYETKRCYVIGKQMIQKPLTGRHISYNSYGTFYEITYIEDKTGIVFSKNVPIEEYENTQTSTSKTIDVCPNENHLTLFGTRVILFIASMLSLAVMLLCVMVIKDSIKYNWI